MTSSRRHSLRQQILGMIVTIVTPLVPGYVTMWCAWTMSLHALIAQRPLYSVLKVSMVGILIFQSVPCRTAMADDLVSDIFLARERDNRAILEIDDVIKKHIRVGDAEPQVVTMLEMYNFNIRIKNEAENNGVRQIIAIKKERRFRTLWLLPEIIKIIITVEGGTVKSAHGTLMTMAP